VASRGEVTLDRGVGAAGADAPEGETLEAAIFSGDFDSGGAAA
jgi:hypothetical protein